MLSSSTKDQLLQLLDSQVGRGRKILFIDHDLAPMLSLLLAHHSAVLLNEHGILKTIHLPTSLLAPPPMSAESLLSTFTIDAPFHIVFLVRPRLASMKCVAKQLKTLARSSTGASLSFHLIFAPRRTIACEKILEDEGILDSLTIHEFHLDLIELDKDLFSMNFNNAFRTLFLEKDDSVLFYLAKALIKLEIIHGHIPLILGKGTLSSRFQILFNSLRKQFVSDMASEGGISNPSQAFGQEPFEGMIVLDRSVDYTTVLLTGLTFESLIDEKFAISCGFIESDILSSGTASKETAKSKHHLVRPTTSIFSSVLSSNFAAVGPQLSSLAKKLQVDYDSRHNVKTVSEMKEFVGKLGDLQSEHATLRLHVLLAEQISKYTQSVFFNERIEMEQSKSFSYYNPFIYAIHSMLILVYRYCGWFSAKSIF